LKKREQRRNGRAVPCKGGVLTAIQGTGRHELMGRTEEQPSLQGKESEQARDKTFPADRRPRVIGRPKVVERRGKLGDSDASIKKNTSLLKRKLSPPLYVTKKRANDSKDN